MKRLLLIVFLSGLFVRMHAVNITVVRVTNEMTEVAAVSSMRFLPGQTIQFTMANGEKSEVSGVRMINFENNDVNRKVKEFIMSEEFDPQVICNFENNDFTAVEDVVASSSIRVYPNPTADMLIIDGAKAKQEIEMYSLNGTKVFSAQSQEGVNTIHVAELPNGVYMLRLGNETFKLIKE